MIEKRETSLPFPRESTKGDTHTFLTQGGAEYDVYKLIAYSKDTMPIRIEVSELLDELENKHWITTTGERLAPKEMIDKYKELGSWEAVLKVRSEWRKHISHLKVADYKKHPILIHGLHVIDGMHRLTRAVIEGATDIDVKIVDQLPENTKLSV